MILHCIDYRGIPSYSRKTVTSPSWFLQEKPENWRKNQNYLLGREIVKKIQPINDSAERGVALMTQYSAKITKNEDQKQFLLQNVFEHRKAVKNANKINFL